MKFDRELSKAYAPPGYHIESERADGRRVFVRLYQISTGEAVGGITLQPRIDAGGDIWRVTTAAGQLVADCQYFAALERLAGLVEAAR